MSAQDFNPYVYGTKPMSVAEAQRHVKAIVNDLNQGKDILSRQAAFLVGLSVRDFNEVEYQNPKNRTARVKMFGRVKLYDKRSAIALFNNYKARSWREHAYIGKRMDSKEARKLLALAYEGLTA